MRVVNVLILLAVAVSVAFGAYRLGDAVDEPAKQLDTVVSTPALAASATAESNLGAAVSAAASYKVDHGSYAGMDASKLRSYDSAIPSDVTVKKATRNAYCVESTVRGSTVSIAGPNGTFAPRGC